MGLNAALNSGRTSLQTNQKAIEITGLNIANVNTPGYSRQSPRLTPYPALNFGDYFIGTGVQVGNVERSHDIFLSGQISGKTAEVGYESSMTNPLAELERVISISEGSLSDEFDKFFDSWRQLSTNPGGEVERQQVLQRGELVADSFVSVYNETQQVRKNINATIDSMVDGVNLRLNEIAQLNTRIPAIEAAGQDANGDRDRRDLLLKELSQMVGARTFETSSGSATVQLSNGMPLVEGNQATPLQAVKAGIDTNIELVFGTTTITLSGSAMGGEFGGLYQVRDTMIPDVVNRLDQLATTFASEVNAQHLAGTNLDGTPGENFFTAPGSPLESQAYPSAILNQFGTGSIDINVNGTVTTVAIAAGSNSVTGIAAAINGSGANVVASVDPTDNSFILVPVTAGENVKVDSSGLSGGSYARPLFNFTGMSSSLSMNVTSTTKIAAGTSSAPGDNTNALDILQIEQKQLLGNDTFVSYYGKIAATVGVESARNRQAAQGHGDSLIQLQNMRDGIDGVSIEDEMIDLLKYQKGFEASAKFLSTIDEMLATLMTLKR